MENVNALGNKMGELSVLTTQHIFGKSSLFVFTDMWLTCCAPEANVDLLEFTSVRNRDRDAKANRKSKDGELIIYINNPWYNPGHALVNMVLCCQDIQQASVVSLGPYYQLTEFSHMIGNCIYVPPRANAATACEKIHTTMARLQTTPEVVRLTTKRLIIYHTFIIIIFPTFGAWWNLNFLEGSIKRTHTHNVHMFKWDGL